MVCQNCGTESLGSQISCPKCGLPLASPFRDPARQAVPTSPVAANTSGRGEESQVPAEILHWNWGAFLLNWIWGIGNSTWIALLCFVPLVNIIMPFVLGAKGNAWAWQNRRWESVEEFRRVQRRWAKAGVVVVVASMLLATAAFTAGFYALGHSEIVESAVTAAQRNPEATRVLGAPIERDGLVSGKIETNDDTDSANFAVPVKGSEASGTIYVEASKNRGQWIFQTLVLVVDGQNQRIDLIEAD